MAITIDRKSAEDWDGHSIEDGCRGGGTLPFSLSLLVPDNFKSQEFALKGFLVARTEIVRQTLGLGDKFDPRDLREGSIVRIEQDILRAERVPSSLQKLRWAFTFGLWEPNQPWADPEYRQSTEFGVVGIVNRFREEPIQGLVTFDRERARAHQFLGEAYLFPRGHAKPAVLEVGRVNHVKLFNSVSLDDTQFLSRVTRIQLLAS